MVPTDPLDPQHLDEAEKLPKKNRVSYYALIAVQALNAFNDNFVKMLLVAFAGVVGKGTHFGDSMQLYMGAIFSLPYVLFAPVAGWLSDHFSKQKVILWMQVAQVGIFVLFHIALALRQTELSLWLSLGCFFFLATQSAIFSPAKFGIMKELVGAKRLGSTTGTLQLTNFMGILGGMGIAGWWFGSLIQDWSRAKQSADYAGVVTHVTPTIYEWINKANEFITFALHDKAWDVVNYLVGVTTLIAVLQIIGSMMIQRTPSHPEVTFYKGLWTEHVSHLKLLFSQRPIKLAALGITYFWLVSNAVGAILVTLSHEMYPNDGSSAAKAMSMMPAMLGIGVMIGSVIAGMICRKKIELGLVPISGYLLALTLLWTGIVPMAPWVYMALIGVGIAGGVFMTPLYAFVQDRSRPEERARIMSAINLMDCVGAIFANMILVKLFLVLKIPAPWQLIILVPFTLAAAVFITRLLPQSFLHLIGSAIVKVFYKVRPHHEPRMPKEGGVLLLPNHMSYADALMLGVSSSRKIRFVMIDTLYKLKAINWGLKVFGTVPISATKPREAIRTVSDALKDEQAIVLFPEGQLTRTGFLNELYKGYELMARTAGDVKVQPVWLDGLWGSVFSFDGGKFFNKLPKKIRYGVSVWFGEPIPAREATVSRVREALTALSAEAFESRINRLSQPKELTRMAWINALRILDTTLLPGINTIRWRITKDHVMTATFTTALAEMRDLKFVFDGDYSSQENVLTIVADTTSVDVTQLTGRYLVLLDSNNLPEVINADYTALYDSRSGTLISLSVPHPVMPKGEEGYQHGYVSGSLGHVLNGLSVKENEHGIVIGALGEHLNLEVQIPGVGLDQEGFMRRKPVV